MAQKDNRQLVELLSTWFKRRDEPNIIAVKYAEFTGTQSASVASGGNVAITDLSISHAMAKSTNKLLVLGQAGSVANSDGYGNVGIAIAAGGTLLTVGTSVGSRIAVSAGGLNAAPTNYITPSRTIVIQYSPSSTSSITYTLNAINIRNATSTVYINRTETAIDSAVYARAASTLTLIELEG